MCDGGGILISISLTVVIVTVVILKRLFIFCLYFIIFYPGNVQSGYNFIEQILIIYRVIENL